MKKSYSHSDQNISLKNRFSLLCMSNEIEQAENLTKKINKRVCQYTPTWLKSGNGSQKEVRRNTKHKSRSKVYDINIREISNLEKMKNLSNISNVARETLESIVRNSKSHYEDHQKKKILKSTSGVESNNENINSLVSNEMEVQSEKNSNVHGCQTLREFLRAKEYKLQNGIPIPYVKLMNNGRNDDNLIDQTMNYLDNIVYRKN